MLPREIFVLGADMNCFGVPRVEVKLLRLSKAGSNLVFVCQNRSNQILCYQHSSLRWELLMRVAVMSHSAISEHISLFKSSSGDS